MAPARTRTLVLSWLPGGSPVGFGLGLEGRVDVVPQCEPEVGRGGHDTPEADRGSDRDQDPHDLVKARSGREGELRARVVGAWRGVDGQERGEPDHCMRFWVESRGLDRVLAHAEQRRYKAIVAEGDAAQPLLIFQHVTPGAWPPSLDERVVAVLRSQRVRPESPSRGWDE